MRKQNIRSLLSMSGLAAVLLAGLAALATPAFAQKDHLPTSEWWSQVEEIDAALRKQKWRSAGKRAAKLAQTVQRRSWYGRDLGRVLAELELYQAVAEANLGNRYQALWHWHTASNLDLKIRSRDLSPYGSAARLLLEFPLRRQGVMPAGFEPGRPTPGGSRERPVMPELIADPVLNNTGAALEGSGDCQVELIVDESGRLHQPVVLSTHLHPVVIHGVLQSLPKLGGFQPARYDGVPADTIIHLTIKFHVVRW